jgi:hypothetical protein
MNVFYDDWCVRICRDCEAGQPKAGVGIPVWVAVRCACCRVLCAGWRRDDARASAESAPVYGSDVLDDELAGVGFEAVDVEAYYLVAGCFQAFCPSAFSAAEVYEGAHVASLPGFRLGVSGFVSVCRVDEAVDAKVAPLAGCDDVCRVVAGWLAPARVGQCQAYGSPGEICGPVVDLGAAPVSVGAAVQAALPTAFAALRCPDEYDVAAEFRPVGGVGAHVGWHGRWWALAAFISGPPLWRRRLVPL